MALWEGVEDITVKAVNNPGQAFTYRSLAAQRNGAWLRACVCRLAGTCATRTRRSRTETSPTLASTSTRASGAA